MENNNTVIPRTIIIDGIEGFNTIVDTLGNSIKITFEKIEPKAEPKLPKTWEELKVVSGYRYTLNCGWVYTDNALTDKECRNTFPTREEAEASIALAQLLQLRNAYNGKRDMSNDGWYLEANGYNSYLFCFHTQELRDRFQSTFSELIKTASPLL